VERELRLPRRSVTKAGNFLRFPQSELQPGTPVFGFSTRQSEKDSEYTFFQTIMCCMDYYYAYILESEKYPDRYYTGFTRDVEARLKHHNSGGDPHTAKYRPWKIKTYIAFTDKQQALDFERYLKTSSGRAFAKKRL
jgi:predicted GIY-YIG superfamily endonuclease